MSFRDITFLLNRARDGDEDARERLYAKLYDQLRNHAKELMRGERADHTLQASALINEACLKLIQEGAVDSAANRRQLFHAAIRAMRQVLVDHARARATEKRGAAWKRTPINIVLDRFESTHQLSYLDLEIALERLQKEATREFEVLHLRFFANLTITETANLMGCSESTVEADWRLARARLLTWLRDA